MKLRTFLTLVVASALLVCATLAVSLTPVRAAGPASVWVVGQEGAAQVVPADLSEVPPHSVKVAIDGVQVRALAHGGDAALAGGPGGRVQRVGSAGEPLAPVQIALGGNDVEAAAFGGGEWLVGGAGGRVQRVDAGGLPLGSWTPALDGGVVRAIGHASGVWVVAGHNGRYQLFDAALTPMTSVQVALGGATVRAVGFNGVHWLLGGDSGRIQRIDASGALAELTYTPSLSGNTVHAIAALGAQWRVGGDGGRTQRVLADGTVVAESFLSLGGGWKAAVATDDAWILAGDGGRLIRVDAADEAGEMWFGIDSAHAASLTWTGEHALVGGSGGRVQAADAAARPITPFASMLGRTTITAASFGDDQILVVGGDRAQILGADGAVVHDFSDIGPLYSTGNATAAAFDGQQWLVAATSGRWSRVSPDGEMLGNGNLSTWSWRTVVYTGLGFVLAGDNGRAARLSTSGTLQQSVTDVFGGVRVWGAAATTQRVLLVGEQGRARVYGPELAPLSGYLPVLNGLDAYTAASSGDRFLVGGGMGYVQPLGLDGEELGPPRRALGDVSVRAIVWLGDGWLVAGHGGQMRRVSPDGEPLGEIVQVLDGLDIRGLAAVGGAVAPGLQCTTGAQCAGGECTGGTCACGGCTIDDVCWGDGQGHPSDPCLMCVAAVATSAWSARAEGSPCGAGTACWPAGACEAGACSTAAVDCDDGDPCTDDVCDPSDGACGSTPREGACDDGDPCTLAGTCEAGVCAPGAPVSCDDGNPCTDDACDPQSGACVHTANAAPCDDGNPCTEGDTCSLGACDGALAADGAACDAGEGCGAAGACAAGVCQRGLATPSCGDLLVGGAFGAVTRVGSDLDVTFDEVRVALDGGTIHAVAMGPAGVALAVGVAGRAQRIDASGQPLGEVSTVLAGNTAQAVGWGADRWLVTGLNQRAHFVLGDGSVGLGPITLPTTAETLVSVYGPGVWLVGGRDGQTTLVDEQGQTTPMRVMLGGSWIHAAAYNGVEWLVAGVGGRYQRVAADGTAAAPVEIALGGSRVRAVAWAPELERWILVGDGGAVQHVDAAGYGITQTYQRVGSGSWATLSWTGGGALVASLQGAMMGLDSSGLPATPSLQAMDGYGVNASVFTGAAFLVAGEQGRVRRRAATASGGLGLPYVTVFDNQFVDATAFDGERWYVGGTGEVATFAPDLTPITDPVLAQSWNHYDAAAGDGQALFAGQFGRFALVNVAGEAIATGNGPSTLYAVAYNGAEYLIAGAAGYARRVTTTGAYSGPQTTALNGETIWAAAAVGSGWVVGGAFGGLQRLNANAEPAGPVVGSIDNVLVRRVVSSGERLLVAGEFGRVQVFTPTLEPIGPVRVALHGETVRAAAWVGDGWVVGGELGYLQRLSPDGEPLGEPVRALDGYSIRELDYTGASRLGGAACHLDVECMDGACVQGQCACAQGCTIGGGCVAEGALHPDSPCLRCDSGADAFGWSPRPDSEACAAADLCEGAGTCEAGVCVRESLQTCEDGDPCTESQCDPATGLCTHAPADGAACDDGDLCTGSGVCSAGVCTAGPPVSCDDGNPCTDDGCDPISGACELVPNTAPCDDGDPCTAEAACSAGACGAIAVVQDGTPCGAPGDCTEADVCVAGQCSAGPARPGCGPLLVGGGNGRVQLVGASLEVPPASVRTILAGQSVRALSLGPSGEVLAGAANGRVQLLDAAGAPLTSPVQAIGANLVDDIALGDGAWLVSGQGGRVARVDLDGNVLGQFVVALDGGRAWEALYVGPHWLVAGDGGRVQAIGPSGLPVGSPTVVFPDASRVDALCSDGVHVLAASDSGWSVLLDAQGQPVGEPRPVLATAAAHDCAWTGSRYVVVGASARYQAVAADGTPDANSLRSVGTGTWRSIAWSGDGGVMVSLSSWSVGLGADLEPVGEVYEALDGAAARKVIAAAGAYLLGGDGGALQWAASDGRPGTPYLAALPGETLWAVGASVGRWLVAAGRYTRLLDLDTTPLTPGIPDGAVLGGSWGAYAAAPGPGGYLVAGQSGRMSFVNEAGVRTEGPLNVGSSHFAASYGGAGFWLVCGAAGACRRVSAGPLSAQAVVTTLSGETVRAAVDRPGGWLIGGDGGLVQAIRADGEPDGPPQQVLSGTTRALASSGLQWLAVGDGGAYRLLGADGTPLASERVALGGSDVRAAIWDGGGWALAGLDGRMQRVDAAGELDGPVVEVLDGADARALAYGGPGRAPGAHCALAEQCRSGVCVAGVCGADCTVGGVAFVAGEQNPANPCEVCDPSQSAVAFTVRADGFLCEDGDPCTVADACLGGACVPGPAKGCDDGDACTSDRCRASDGACEHLFVGGVEGCGEGLLFAGGRGRLQIAEPDALVPPVSYEIALEGQGVRGMAEGTEGVLMVGLGGLVQLVDSDRKPLGPAVEVVSGHAYAVAFDGEHFLVGGTSGRIRRVTAAGVPVGVDENVLSSATIEGVIALPGGGFVVAGTSGRIRRFDAEGVAVGPWVVRNDGWGIYGIARSETHLLVVGQSGRMQRLDFDLEPAGDVVLVSGVGHLNGVAFDGARWMAASSSGFAVPVELSGEVAPSGPIDVGSGWNAVAAGDGGWLVVGASGGARRLDAFGFPVGAASTLLADQSAFAVSWRGAEWWAAGNQGYVQRVNTQGRPVVPYSVALQGRTIRFAAFDGEGWVVGGDEFVQRLDRTGEPLGAPEAVFSPGTIVRAGERGAEGWMVLGAGGLVATSSDGVSWTEVPGGFGAELNDLAWGGDRWLLAGDGGVAQVRAQDGALLAEPPALLGGQDVLAVASDGDGWLVAGRQGLVQRVGLDGAPAGPPALRALNLDVRALGFGDGGFLAGTAGGYVQRLGPAGEALTPAVRVWDGVDVHRVAWTGAGWVVAGASGQVLRLDSALSPQGEVQVALDGDPVWAVTYAGAVAAEAGSCTSDLQCPTGQCLSGSCGCAQGCAVDGACVAAGASVPGQACLVCDPAADPSGLVAVADGQPCDDAGACADEGSCDAGACAQAVPDCDDENPCTQDACDPQSGACVHAPRSGAPCDDGDLCTGPGVCDGMSCQAAPIDCDDGNPCTTDSCDEMAGCVHDFVEGACDDGNPCTATGSCELGACAAGEALADGTACGADGDACEAGDTCLAGTCARGPAILGCAEVVLAGQSGMAISVSRDFSEAELAGQQLLQGQTARDAAAGDTHLLVVGNSGRVQRVGFDGFAEGFVDNALSSATVHVVRWTGDRWIVGGSSGRVGFVNADGTYAGSFVNVLSSASVRAIAPGPGGYLVAGHSGRYRRIDAEGDSSSELGTVPGGAVIRAAVWTGARWLLGTEAGELWSLDQDLDQLELVSVALGGRAVMAMSYTDAHGGVMAGGEGRLVRFDAWGQIDAESLSVVEGDVTHLSEGPGGWLAQSSDGSFAYVDGATGAVSAPRLGVGGQAGAGAPYTGQGFLMVGAGGVVQRLDAGGEPVVPYFQSSSKLILRAAAAAADQVFLAGSTQGFLLSFGLKVQAAIEPILQATSTWNRVAYTVSPGPEKWLVAGSWSRYVLVTPEGVSDPVRTVSVSWRDLFASAYGDEAWLVAGNQGLACRVALSGQDLGCVTALSSGHIYAATWVGSHWLVGGADGRIQRVAPSGEPDGPVQLSLLNFAVRTLAPGVDRVLAGGDAGFVQLVELDGTPVGAAQDRLGGNAVRAAIWLGDQWVIVGDGGATRRIDADGQPVGPIQTGLFGRDIYAVAYAGATRGAGEGCQFDYECLSGGCEDGVCLPDCVIDGVAYLDGARNPANSCEICQVGLDASQWTGLADGAPCSDGDACTVGDACAAGACVSGAVLDCDDGIDCTVDSCDDATGQCVHDVTGAPTCLTCGNGIIDAYTDIEAFLGAEPGMSPSAFGLSASQWVLTSAQAKVGEVSAVSTNTSPHTTATMSMPVETAAGEVCFAARGSSQSCCDRFRFFIDGAQVLNLANFAWTDFCFPVTAGSHVLQWRYEKGGGGSAGEDRYYVDHIRVPKLEVCDDGNTVSGDGCAADCLSDETCGNGIVDVGEVCDDGNNVSGDGCSEDCLSDETCGNGIVDVGEECDDGNTLPGDGCSPLCTLEGVCGNGVIDIVRQALTFEAAPLGPAGLGEAFWWTAGGGGWTVEDGVGREGSRGVKTENTGLRNSRASLWLHHTASEASELCFWVKGTAHPGGDALEVAVDGEVVLALHSASQWERRCVAVGEGDHTYSWTYAKDGGPHGGTDTFFLDDITLPRGPFEACDPGDPVAGASCSDDCLSDGSCGNFIVDPEETCDLPPAEPVGALQATTLAGGFVALSWPALDGEGEGLLYAVWRAAAPLAEVEGLVPEAYVSASSFTDRPPTDGTWHYAVTALRAPTHPGPLSPWASGVADGTPPQATISLASPSPLGEGSHGITLTSTKALADAPTLWWVSSAAPGVYPVALSATANPLVYTGAVQISKEAPQGPAQFFWEATDLTGNPQGQITSGSQFSIDTRPIDPPSGLLVVASGSDSLELSWTASPDPYGQLGGYRVEVDGEPVLDTPAGVTFATVVGLQPGAAYTLGVRAVETGGYASPAATTLGVTWLPHPTDLVAVGTDQRAELSFTPHAPGAWVGAQRVYVRSEPFTSVAGLAPSLTLNKAATAATVSGLANGQTVYVAVTTVNVHGGEDPAVIPVAVTPVDDEPPPRPLSLVVTGGDGTSLSVSWTPSSNPAGDLAGYRLWVDGVAVQDVSGGVLTHTFTGLQPSGKYTLGVSAFDTSGNDSAPRTRLGYTLMPNPAGVSVIEEGHARLVVGFSPVAPTANIQHYRVWASPAPFTSVAGMTPVATVGASASQATVTGLTNGQLTYVAVTTRNRSGLESPAVVAASGTPQEDTTPPTITGVTYAGAPFVGGITVTKSGTLSVSATDAEGIGGAVFFLDGAQFAVDTTPKNGLTAFLDLLSIPDGPHVLGLEVSDTVGNVATATYAFSVALAPPDPPVITAPANGASTSEALVLVKGTAEPQSTVTLFRGGALVSGTVKADGAGAWSKGLTLSAGANELTARAANRGGQGIAGPATVVTLDQTVPAAPKGLGAAPGEGGEIKLTWFAGDAANVGSIAGYRVYRAAEPFSAAEEATLLNPGALVSAFFFTDLPPSDGAWYYRVSARNAAGTFSALSELATAVADGTPPEVVSLQITPQGAHAEDGRVGVGPVKVDVTFSEPLLTTPFLAFAPPGGLPVTVGLAKVGDQTFSGVAQVLATTKSGVAPVVVSARDLVGNRGTAVAAGQPQSLHIDTHAPHVVAVSLDPPAPIRNEAEAPVEVEVEVELSEPMSPGEVPELRYTLSQSSLEPAEVALEPITPTRWRGALALDASSGDPPEVLAFTFFAADDLGNESTLIQGKSAFEVYQGSLPPLLAPVSVTATARPAGAAEVSWSAVAGAAEYEVHRIDPGGSTFAAVGRTAGTSWTEVPGPDGAYLYAISSVRHANGQETLSALSTAASVTTDSVAPGAPTALSLQLGSNGVLLTWSAPEPAGGPLTYSVYRAAGAELESVEGLTPILAGVPGTQVVDTSPSHAEHAYVVVAVDVAGNASPPSPSAYLNAGLLPVQNLAVLYDTTIGDGPRVSWTHPTAGMAGFALTADGAPLGEGPVLGSPYFDPSYGGGGRTYGVRAVDGQGFESLERFVDLPALTATPRPDAGLVRGQISEVRYTVVSDRALVGASLSVQLGGQSHPSSAFSAAAGEAVEVPVVLGGYAALPDSATLRATVSATAPTGESVAVVQQSQIPVGEGSYAVDLLVPTLVRDAKAEVRFAFHNPRALPLELIAAQGAGTQPSPDVRALITDLDGNLLASAPLFAALGEGVINVGGGTTVARIPAGESYTSPPIVLDVPADAPETVRVVLEIDRVHYRVGHAQHVWVQGLSTSTLADTAQPPYEPTVQSAAPAVSKGEGPILISGVATDPDGVPVPGVPVDLKVALSGFVRTFAVFTDGAGAFSYAFTPLPNEGGVYQTWANYPGSKASVPEASFTVQRVLLSPAELDVAVAANYTYALSFKATALPGVTLTAARLEPSLLATGVELSLPAPRDVQPGADTTFAVGLLTSPTAPAEGELFLNLVSDEGSWGTVRVGYVRTTADPSLQMSPHWVETGVLRGESVTESLTVSNKGLAQFEQLSFRLRNAAKTAPAPSWVFVSGGAQVGALGTDQQATVSVTAAPPQSTPLSAFGPYTFWLQAMEGAKVVGEAPLYVWVDDTGLGGHLFKISDIYTNTLGSDGELILGLAGATVKLDKILGAPHSASMTTDAAGEALFTGLPVGTYKFRASAPGHEAVEGNLTIKPMVVGTSEVLLPIPLVLIEWQVTETSVADKYTVVLTATFETDVPAPVVVTEPTSVQLPYMQQGDVFYGEYTLTNHGLIRADNLAPKIPGPDEIQFELLAQPPPKLEAKESVTIPYRVTRLAAAEPPGEASGGGCLPKGKAIAHCYTWICANGLGSSGCTGMGVKDGNGSGGGGSGCKGGGGGPWWPWGFGGAAGGGGPGCDPCNNPNASGEEQGCCEEGKSQPSGSAVDLIRGDYTDDATDLVVKALGFDVALQRFYAGRQWTFRYLGLGLKAIGSGSNVSAIDHLGIRFASADEAGEYFSSGSETIRVFPAGSTPAYEWTNPAGDWRRFDAAGRLYALGDSNQRQLQLEYDAGDRLVALRDTFGGLVASYEYQGSNLVAIETRDGRRAEYSWQSGRLVGVSLPGELSYTYAYDGQGRLVHKVLPSGEERFVTYKSNDTVESVLDAAGRGMHFAYGYNSGTQQNYAAILHTSGMLEEKWFDKSGAVVQHLRDGEPVARLASRGVIDASLDGRKGAVVHAGGVKGIEWQHDAAGRPLMQRDHRGVQQQLQRDGAGNITRMTIGVGRPDAQVYELEYDALGRALVQRRLGDADTSDEVMTQTWDEFGNLTSRTLPGGRTTTFEWDAAGRLTGMTEPSGYQRVVERDARGRLSRIATLDPAGELEQETRLEREARFDEEGVFDGERVRIEDTLLGNSELDEDLHGRPVRWVDSGGRQTTVSYDARGRVVLVRSDNGRERTFEYAAQPFGQERVTERVDGETVAVEDRDRFGRLVRREESGREVYWMYDGAYAEPVEMITPEHRFLYAYDPFGRLVTRTRMTDGEVDYTEEFGWFGESMVYYRSPSGREQAWEPHVTDVYRSRQQAAGVVEQMALDAFGRATAAWDADERLVLEHGYDAIGDLTSVSIAGRATLSASHGAIGAPEQLDYSDGRSVELSYDGDGRPTAIRYEDSSAPTGTQIVEHALQYGARDEVVGSSSPALTWSSTWLDPGRHERWTYDFGGVAATVEYRYDADGSVVQVVYPDGAAVDYERDAVGRLVGAAVPGLGELTWAYPEHTRQRQEASTGLELEWTRDGEGRLLTLHAEQNGATVESVSITRAAGRVQAVTRAGQTTTYLHDAREQLVEVSGPDGVSEGYGYDLAGNRIQSAATGSSVWTYDAAGRLLTAGSALTYAYDSQGRVASREVGGTLLELRYDAAGRLVRVQDDQGALVAEYGYDAQGRRVRKTAQGDTVYYVYGREGLLAELNETGQVLRRYGWMPDREWMSTPLWVHGAEGAGWIIADDTGAPLHVVDGEGETLWRADVEAFGWAVVEPGESIALSLRRSGQQHDPETGLHYNGARYYDPATGRYLAPDPELYEAATLNPYVFVENDPLHRSDWFGALSTSGGGKYTGGTGGFGHSTNLCLGGGVGLTGAGCVETNVSVSRCCGGVKVCMSISGVLKGGVGASARFGAAGVSLNVATAGVKYTCKSCVGCGENGEEQCGFSWFAKGPSGGANFGPLGVEAGGPGLSGPLGGPGGPKVSDPYVNGSFGAKF